MVKAKAKKAAPETVTVSINEFQLIADGLGYKDRQSLIDNLVIGVIPRTADPGAPPKVSLEIVGLGKSPQVAYPRSDDSKKNKRQSWANEVKEAEAAEKLADLAKGETEKGEQLVKPDEQIAKKADPIAKPWAEIIRGNRAFANGMTLAYIQLGEEMLITEEEWEEGAKLWHFPTVAKVLHTRPVYSEMQKWASINWKSNTPRVSQLKPGGFLF